MRRSALLMTALIATMALSDMAVGDEYRGGGGEAFFQSLGESGNKCNVTSSDVNCKVAVNTCDFVNKLVREAGKNRGKSSEGYCARGVRSAFQETCTDAIGSAWCSAAKDMGGCLQKMGLKSDDTELQKAKADPSYRPKKGAVLVYSSSDPNHPGHVEIYTGQDFCSDFCSTNRRDQSAPGERILIGIYNPPVQEDCGS
jgi:hypothetical protein